MPGKWKDEGREDLLVKIDCPYCGQPDHYPVRAAGTRVVCENDNDHVFEFMVETPNSEDVRIKVRKAQYLAVSPVFTMKEREVLPSGHNGVDYGAPQQVLLRHGEMKIVFIPGHSYWSGIGMSSYAKAAIEAMHFHGREVGHLPHKEVFEGRISKDRVESHADVLAELVGLIGKDNVTELDVAQAVYAAYKDGVTYVYGE